MGEEKSGLEMGAGGWFGGTPGLQGATGTKKNWAVSGWEN